MCENLPRARTRSYIYNILRGGADLTRILARGSVSFLASHQALARDSARATPTPQVDRDGSREAIKSLRMAEAEARRLSS